MSTDKDLLERLMEGRSPGNLFGKTGILAELTKAVATARKLAMIIWHMLSKDADYIWARPALLARKFRAAELRAGLPTKHARRGAAYDYNIPAKRAEERSRVEKVEAVYTDLTSRWRTRPKGRKAVEKPAV